MLLALLLLPLGPHRIVGNGLELVQSNQLWQLLLALQPDLDLRPGLETKLVRSGTGTRTGPGALQPEHQQLDQRMVGPLFPLGHSVSRKHETRETRMNDEMMEVHATTDRVENTGSTSLSEPTERTSSCPARYHPNPSILIGELAFRCKGGSQFMEVSNFIK